MRNAFAAEITERAASDSTLALLSGDIGNRLFDKFKDAAPGRFFNCGVAEANMVGVAAGMALSGLRPVAYTIAPFITARVLEQIRDDLCYNRAPAILVGVGGGLSYASLGPTHHSWDDIALLRPLPGMTVLCPADAMEVRSCLGIALGHDGPVYIRLGKKGEPLVHDAPPDLEIGGSLQLREGSDVCVLAVGNMVVTALEAADLLAARGVSAAVISCYGVKPMDEAMLARAFDTFRLVATVEEHGLIGGFGAAVAEWSADRGPSTARLCRFGMADRFMKEAGEQAYARERFGLTAERIAERLLGRL